MAGVIVRIQGSGGSHGVAALPKHKAVPMEICEIKFLIIDKQP